MLTKTQTHDDFFSKLLKHIENSEFGYNGIMDLLKKEKFFLDHPELNEFKNVLSMKQFNESSDSGLLFGTDEKIYNFPYLMKQFAEKMNGILPLSKITEFYSEYGSIKKVLQEKGILNLINKFGQKYGLFLEKEFIIDRYFNEDLKIALIEFVQLHNGEVLCSFLEEFYTKNPKFSNYVKKIGIKKLVNFVLVWRVTPENPSKIVWSEGYLKLTSSAESDNIQIHENSNNFNENYKKLYFLLLKFVKEKSRTKMNCNFLADFYKKHPTYAEILKQKGIKRFLQNNLANEVNPVLNWNQGYLEIKTNEASIIEKSVPNKMMQPANLLTSPNKIPQEEHKNQEKRREKSNKSDKSLYILLVEFVKKKNGKTDCSYLGEFYKKYPKESETLKKKGVKRFLENFSRENKDLSDVFLIFCEKGYLELKKVISQQNCSKLETQVLKQNSKKEEEEDLRKEERRERTEVGGEKMKEGGELKEEKEVKEEEKGERKREKGGGNAQVKKKNSKWMMKKKKKNWDFNNPFKQKIKAPENIFQNNIKQRQIVELKPYYIPFQYLASYFFKEEIDVFELEKSLKNILGSNEHSKNYIKDANNYAMLDLNNLSAFFGFFQMLMHAEEVKMKVEMCNYDIDGANFQRSPNSFDNLYELAMPGLAERRPSVLCGDRMILESLSYKIFASIWKVKENSILVAFPENMVNQSYIFDVHFEFNRTPLKLMHRALEKWSQYKTLHKFFDDWTLPALPNYPLAFLTRELNKMQSTVIQALLKSCETLFQQPLIIFGPPGTGKTTTIIEGIIQILKKKINSKILVCTPSNSSADLICERLINAFEIKGNMNEFKNFQRTKIVRICAASRNPDSVPQKLKDKCNVYFSVPANEKIISGDVIVTTGSSAGYLVSLRLQIFSHIFFDEAGESLVGDTLIPFSLKNEDTTIIIAGDPKQLGPIVTSPTCLNYGMDISLLERLFNLKLKQLNNKIPSVEELLKVGVFHLIDNYRAHEGILKIYNDQFYHSKLQAKGDQTLIKWRGLKNPNIPLLFKHVIGQEEREEDSPSWFNQTEIDEVFGILHQLKNEKLLINRNVGIITPYRKQCSKIRNRLKTERFSNVDVGTTEFFQGDERNIIIVTCVRSQKINLQADYKFHLGFVANSKRINVAISRAKNLLIILGNAELLYSDSIFKQILEKFNDAGCYEGPDFKKFSTNPPLESLISKLDAIGTDNLEDIKIN